MLENKKKICFITGTRAEYGLLNPLLNRVKKDNKFELQLIVTGMHLVSEYGDTYKKIEEDDFFINEKIEINLSSDSPIGISKSVGLGMISFSEAYNRLKPDIIVVLGDRYEILSAAISAYISNIPIAHIGGGDITEGAQDEAFRHSITKMSYLHFSGNEKARERIIQLGENPQRVFNVGSLGVENISNLKLYNLSELETKLKIKLSQKYFLVLIHSTTLEDNTSNYQIKNLIKVLDKYKDYNIIFIKGNSDGNGQIINNIIEKYKALNENKVKLFTSLSTREYLSLLKYSEILIGNSSSGIVEAPSLKKLSINLGDRQKGREKGNSVIDCSFECSDIERCINNFVLGNYNYLLKKITSPYDKNGASSLILEKIAEVLLLKKINLKKKFYDIK